jgi:hypothetical protein
MIILIKIPHNPIPNYNSPLSFYHLLVGDDMPSVHNVVGNELTDPLHKGWPIWSHLSFVHHSINEWMMSQSCAGSYFCMSMPSQRFDMGMVEEGVFEWWKHHQCEKMLSKFKYKEKNLIGKNDKLNTQHRSLFKSVCLWDIGSSSTLGSK